MRAKLPCRSMSANQMAVALVDVHELGFLLGVGKEGYSDRYKLHNPFPVISGYCTGDVMHKDYFPSIPLLDPEVVSSKTKTDKRFWQKFQLTGMLFRDKLIFLYFTSNCLSMTYNLLSVTESIPSFRFGVCCVFIVSTSGGVVQQNCSYIQNPGYPSSYTGTSSVTYTIQKCNTGYDIFVKEIKLTHMLWLSLKI